MSGCRLVLSRALTLLDAKPPKPPAMPCRWFLILGGAQCLLASRAATEGPQRNLTDRRAPAPNRSTVELREVPKARKNWAFWATWADCLRCRAPLCSSCSSSLQAEKRLSWGHLGGRS